MTKFVLDQPPETSNPVVISLCQDGDEVDVFFDQDGEKRIIMTFKAEGYVELYGISNVIAGQMGIQREGDHNFIKFA